VAAVALGDEVLLGHDAAGKLTSLASARMNVPAGTRRRAEPGPPQEQGWQAVGANTTTGETIPITAYAQCSK
jgi:hypothetical protein